MSVILKALAEFVLYAVLAAFAQNAVLSRALQYFGTIVLFGAGAAAGSLMTMRFGMWVIWVSSALLSVSFFLMFWKADEKELQVVGRKLERELCTVEEKAEHKLEHLEEKHR